MIVACLVATGCSKPIEPPPSIEPEPHSSESTEVEQSNTEQQEDSEESTEEKASEEESSQSDKPDQNQQKSKPPAKSEPTGGQASQAPQSKRSSSGKGANASSRKPKSPAEAVRWAKTELSKSEKTSDLSKAYRYAANAYQLAKTFPGDKKGLAISDAALGRLRALEKQGVTLKELGSTSEVNGKTIIELP